MDKPERLRQAMTQHGIALLRMRVSIADTDIQTARLRPVAGDHGVFGAFIRAIEGVTRALDTCAAQIETTNQQLESEVDEILGQ